MLRLFSSGPIRREGEKSAKLFSSKSTNLIFVALSEEMVVNETIETWKRAHEVAKELEEPLIFLNRSADNMFSEEESVAISELSRGCDNPLVAAGEWRLELDAATKSARVRLERETSSRVVVLPEIPHSGGEAGVVSGLAEALQEIDRGANWGAQR
jgi:hypothetical protein